MAGEEARLPACRCSAAGTPCSLSVSPAGLMEKIGRTGWRGERMSVGPNKVGVNVIVNFLGVQSIRSVYR
jgi:hypothetical protein